jgi:hypothetical protein
MSEHDQKGDAPESPGSDDHGVARRAALRKIAASLAVVGGGAALPDKWTKPVVETIVRPASAAPTEIPTLPDITTTA